MEIMLFTQNKPTTSYSYYDERHSYMTRIATISSYIYLHSSIELCTK